MNRILLILAIAVLLLPAPPSGKEEPLEPSSVDISAVAVPLDADNPDRTSLGPLTFLGAWTLSSAHPLFGGISSLLVQDDGSLLGLSDSSVLIGFPAPTTRRTDRAEVIPGHSFIAPLPVMPQEADWPIWKWDSEALVHDPESDKYWVSFELIARICRYSSALARVESCARPPDIYAWPKTEMGEAMVRLPDGRFLIFGEGAPGRSGGLDVLLFSDDPAEQSTPPPMHLSYLPPQGFRPTDAVMLSPDTLILVNRRATLWQGFTATLALVRLPRRMTPDTLLKGEAIALLAPPILADNFEALALSREGERRILWVASDDNHEFFQRSLLLKFALPPGW